MSDSFTETSSVGCGSRLIESIKGVGIGILLLGISVFVLFWNEGRAVHRQQALEEGASSVVSVSADRIDPANEGKLVHVSGDAKTANGLGDETFDIKAPNALILERHSEMYQWKEDEKTETKKKLGGGEDRTTTYTYAKAWDSTLHDSAHFKHQEGHNNPKQYPANLASNSSRAKDAKLGAFSIFEYVLGHLRADKVVAPNASAGVENSTPQNTTKPKVTVSNNMLYTGNPDSPAIGDVRISFKEYPAGPISVVARQSNGALSPMPTKVKSEEIILVQPGNVAADILFKQAEEENKMLSWIIRVAGFIFIAIGFGMIFGPFVTLADVVPFIGSIVGAGTFIAAIICAIPVWAITVAVAWLVYRPIIGIALLAVAVGVPILFMLTRTKKTAAA